MMPMSGPSELLSI